VGRRRASRVWAGAASAVAKKPSLQRERRMQAVASSSGARSRPPAVAVGERVREREREAGAARGFLGQYLTILTPLVNVGQSGRNWTIFLFEKQVNWVE
jgi:hypothetical protein